MEAAAPLATRPCRKRASDSATTGKIRSSLSIKFPNACLMAVGVSRKLREAKPLRAARDKKYQTGAA